MRQGQQNRRNRGRGRSRTSNPLTRNYESNGPDVKIKGTAAHIAEKYMALARDSLSSGNTVTAENYLQHAEHYNRIIMAAQTKQQEEMQNRSGGRNDRAGEQGDDTTPHQDINGKAVPVDDDEVDIPGSGDQPQLAGPQDPEAANRDNGGAAADERPKPRRAPRKPRPAAKADKAEETDTGASEENNALA